MNKKNLSDSAASFATGICILSSQQAGYETPFGMTINTFVSLSFVPPLIGFALVNNCKMRQELQVNSVIGLSILAENQERLSHWFANLTQEQPPLQWNYELSVPLIEESAAWYAATIYQMYPAGDHQFYVAKVSATRAFSRAPLLYFNRKYRQLKPSN